MPASAAQSSKQSVGIRFLLFLAGAVLNYLLISTPLKYLKHHHPDWPPIATAGISLAVSAAFFFFWNYFVNFRTGSRKRDALWRYLAAAAGLYVLSSFTLGFLDGIDRHPIFNLDLHHLFGLAFVPINRDVVATQFCLGGFKFLIYHYWAFPAHKETAG